MGVTERTRARALEWAVSSRPRAGEEVSGDATVVACSGDAALIAVVDALGHGPQAARVAAVAVAALEHAADARVEETFACCHRCLQGTRGAAVGVASFSRGDATLTWLAVGNVAGRLVRAGAAPPAPVESLLLHGGVVGDELPPLRPATLDVRRGDVLLLATDGIDPSFADWPQLAGRPQRIADDILARHARDADDALVLAARFLEPKR